MQTLIVLVFVMLALCPARGDKDMAFRIDLAEAITQATDDPDEQVTLATLAWYESSYRRAVARCEKTGDAGKSKGVFQIQPIGSADAKAVCGSLLDQARVAVAYLRKSAALCSANTGVARYNLYMSGRCEFGTKAAEKRIVTWDSLRTKYALPAPPSERP